MSHKTTKLPARTLMREIYNKCRTPGTLMVDVWERIGAFWGVSGQTAKVWYWQAKKELN